MGRGSGVQEFLDRYKKAREEKKYKEERKNMSTGTSWNLYAFR